MEIQLSEQQISILASQTAKMVVGMLQANGSLQSKSNKYIGVSEAAKLLGISVYHMRRIKDQFHYRKTSGSQQGHLLFPEHEILTAYNKPTI